MNYFFGRKFDEAVDIDKIKENKIALHTQAYLNSNRKKFKYIAKANKHRVPAAKLPSGVFLRTKPVNKLQVRNKRITINRQKRLNAYDQNDTKHHKNKINRPRKLSLQGNDNGMPERHDIQDLTTNTGLLTIKTNQARLLNDYFKFIHLIDLDNYIENINNIKTNIIKIQKLHNFDIAMETLKSKFIGLEQSFQNIYPHIRKRRGLLNIVGTGVKFMTGNMDNEDAIEINNKINDVILNNKQLIKANNNQFHLNEEFIYRFKNLTNHINTQQLIITGILDQISSNLTYGVTYMLYIYQLDFNIVTLKNQFEDISECIKMAKRNVLPKNIMSHKEQT